MAAQKQSAHNPFRTPNLTPNPTGALNANSNSGVTSPGTGGITASSSGGQSRTLGVPSAQDLAASLSALTLTARGDGPSSSMMPTQTQTASSLSPFDDPLGVSSSSSASQGDAPPPVPERPYPSAKERDRDATLPPLPPRERDGSLPSVPQPMYAPPPGPPPEGSVSVSGEARYPAPSGPPPGTFPSSSPPTPAVSSSPPQLPTLPPRSTPTSNTSAGRPRSPPPEFEESDDIPRIRIDDLPELPERPSYSPPPYTPSADLAHGETTVEVGPRRPFQPAQGQGPNQRPGPQPQQQYAGQGGGFPGLGPSRPPPVQVVQVQNTGGSGWGGVIESLLFGNSSGSGGGGLLGQSPGLGPGSPSGRHSAGGRTPVYLPPTRIGPVPASNPSSQRVSNSPNSNNRVSGVSAPSPRRDVPSPGAGLSDFARDFYAAGANPPGVNVEGGARPSAAVPAISSQSRRANNRNGGRSPPSSDDEHYVEFTPPLQPSSASPSTSTFRRSSMVHDPTSGMPGAYAPPPDPPPSSNNSYNPPPGPPPQLAQLYAPPPGPPPRSPDTSRSGAGGGTGRANEVPDDGRPTKVPMGGHPLLLNERVLVYPTGYECRKCSNTGFKHYDPSRPCSKCWDKYAQPYAGTITYAPWGSSGSTSPTSSASGGGSANKAFQRPLPRTRGPPQAQTLSAGDARQGHGHSLSLSTSSLAPSGSATLMRSPSSPNFHGTPSSAPSSNRPLSASTSNASGLRTAVPPRHPSRHRDRPSHGYPQNPNSIVVQPGDPRIGGRLCWNCGGDGVVSVFFFDESTCPTCGGVGRVLR